MRAKYEELSKIGSMTGTKLKRRMESSVTIVVGLGTRKQVAGGRRLTRRILGSWKESLSIRGDVGNVAPRNTYLRIVL